MAYATSQGQDDSAKRSVTYRAAPSFRTSCQSALTDDGSSAQSIRLELVVPLPCMCRADGSSNEQSAAAATLLQQ